MQNDMPSAKDKAAEYRKHGADCFEVAKRMSLKADRTRMIELAEHWLELARLAEAEQSGEK